MGCCWSSSCLTSTRCSTNCSSMPHHPVCCSCTCPRLSAMVRPFDSTSALRRRGTRASQMLKVSTISTLITAEKSHLKLPLSEREIYVVVRSWRCIHEDLTTTGMRMFLRMFETSDLVKEAFEKFRTLDTPSELWQSTVLETHGMVVMNAIDEIITNLDDEEGVIELIFEQGRTHARFGDLSEAMFMAIEEPFMHAVSEHMGDRFTAHIRRLYSRTIQWVLKVLLMGFHIENAARHRQQQEAHRAIVARQLSRKRGSSLSALVAQTLPNVVPD